MSILFETMISFHTSNVHGKFLFGGRGEKKDEKEKKREIYTLFLILHFMNSRYFLAQISMLDSV